MSTVDELMALASRYGIRCYIDGRNDIGETSDRTKIMREALRQAMSVALDTAAQAQPASHPEEFSCPLCFDQGPTPALRPLSDAELNRLWAEAVDGADPTASNAHFRYARAVLAAALDGGIRPR